MNLETLKLALVCLKAGTLVFGGGLVLVPLLEPDVVGRHQWVTHQEFVDAVALGQMTPGPLLVTATFIGYKVGGVVAALLATVSILLPSFLMTIALSTHVRQWQDHPLVKRFLWGAKATVVGLIVAAGLQLAHTSFTTLPPLLLGIGALGLLVATEKVDAGLVVVACGLLGMALWSGG